MSITIPKDKEIVDNNLKLFFTHKTELLDLLDEYNAIPCHHLPPFVSFVDVFVHLQPIAQTIGKYITLRFCELFNPPIDASY